MKITIDLQFREDYDYSDEQKILKDSWFIVEWPFDFLPRQGDIINCADLKYIDDVNEEQFDILENCFSFAKVTDTTIFQSNHISEKEIVFMPFITVYSNE